MDFTNVHDLINSKATDFPKENCNSSEYTNTFSVLYYFQMP